MMRKLFTSMMLLAASMGATATEIPYPGTLAVVIDGSVAQPTKTQVVLDQQEDGKYGLALKNFILVQGTDAMPVGNIVLKDIEAVEGQGGLLLVTKQDILLEAGDAPGVPMWMGPMLGEVPVELEAVIKGDVLTANIIVPIVGQDVEVVFDSREFQLPNAGFEDFHTASASTLLGGTVTSDEPNNWHSFMSCAGAMAGMVSGVPHTFVSDDTRPGSEGTKSVLLKSGAVMGIAVANGTLTTGRLNAGAMDAADTGNNACLDLSCEETDANGDPFYTVLNAMPDSISVWVKFQQGSPVEAHPYATMSAVITDGSYYQEPADADYSGVVVGLAGCNTIESTGEWQRLVLPFYYTNESLLPKGILVTFSTNADAGQGTGSDEMYLDDVELIYNSRLSDLSVNGVTLPGFAPDTYDYEYSFADGTMPTTDELADLTSFVVDGKEAKGFVSVREDNVLTVLVLSADLMSSHAYTIKFTAVADGVESIASDRGEKAVYNLNGQRVSSPKKGGLYITKYANGKTVKSISK